MKKKKMAVLVLSLALVGGVYGAYSLYSGSTNKVENQFNIIAGESDQENAGLIKEPAWENGGETTAKDGLSPTQVVPKDPYIISNVDYKAYAFMKVEIPQFVDAPNTGKDAAELLNLNADGKWKLISDSIDEDTHKHVLIYGYIDVLDGNNSTKAESERAKTSSLFDSFKVPDLTELTDGFTGSIDVTGSLIQAEGFATVEDAAKSLGYNSGTQSKTGDLKYSLDGGTLTGAKNTYTESDYGYVPPTPVKEGYKFLGWSPASLPADSTGNITFTAQWEEDTKTKILGTITYNLDGGTLTGEKTEYTADDYGYAPPEPTKEGYTFTGWSPSVIASGTTGNITFTAGWEDAKAKTAEFLSGEQFNTTLRAIQTRYKTNIKRIENWEEDSAPDAEYLISGNIVSSDASGVPIYLFTEDSSGVYYWYSEADTYYTAENCDKMFQANTSPNLYNLTYVDFSKFDTSNTTSMAEMFEYTAIVNLDLSSFDTSNVTSFERMFYYAGSTSINLSSFRGNKVQTMKNMFYYADDVTSIDLSQLGGTPKLNDITSAFESCKAATKIDVSGITTKKVSKAARAFRSCNKVSELDLSHWDTSLMQEYKEMLLYCESLTDLYLGAEFGHTGDVDEYILEGSYSTVNKRPSWIDTVKVHGANDYVKTFKSTEGGLEGSSYYYYFIFHNFV